MSQVLFSSFMQVNTVFWPRLGVVFYSGKTYDLDKQLMAAFRREPDARLSRIKTFETSSEGV